jgi:hypothetical protein
MGAGVKLLAAMAMAAFLFTQVSHAQPIPGESPKEKAARELKQKRDRDVDSNYKSSLELIPEPPKKNTDPWGNLRAPNAPSAAGPK